MGIFMDLSKLPVRLTNAPAEERDRYSEFKTVIGTLAKETKAGRPFEKQLELLIYLVCEHYFRDIPIDKSLLPLLNTETTRSRLRGTLDKYYEHNEQKKIQIRMARRGSMPLFIGKEQAAEYSEYERLFECLKRTTNKQKLLNHLCILYFSNAREEDYTLNKIRNELPYSGSEEKLKGIVKELIGEIEKVYCSSCKSVSSSANIRRLVVSKEGDRVKLSFVTLENRKGAGAVMDDDSGNHSKSSLTPAPVVPVPAAPLPATVMRENKGGAQTVMIENETPGFSIKCPDCGTVCEEEGIDCTGCGAHIGLPSPKSGSKRAAPAATLSAIPDLLWKKHVGNFVISIAATPDHIATGTVTADKRGQMVLWDSNLGFLEKIPTSEPIRYPPAFNSKDWLFFGSPNGNAYAVEPPPGGKMLMWAAHSAVDSSPLVLDNIIFLGSRGEGLFALAIEESCSFSDIWQFGETGEISASPAFGNGIVYVGSADGYLYAINADVGVQRWKFNGHNAIRSSPVVDNDARIVYFSTISGEFFALKADSGEIIWQTSSQNWKTVYGVAINRPVVFHDNMLIFVSDERLFVLNAPNGALRQVWEAGYELTAPVVDIRSGNIYVGVPDVGLQVLYRQSGNDVPFSPGPRMSLEGHIYAPPVFAGSRLLAATNEGFIYAWEVS